MTARRMPLYHWRRALRQQPAEARRGEREALSAQAAAQQSARAARVADLQAYAAQAVELHDEIVRRLLAADGTQADDELVTVEIAPEATPGAADAPTEFAIPPDPRRKRMH